MASRAKNKPNNKRTYASAVVGVDEKSHFTELAVCNLKAPTNMAHSRIPNTKEEFSFFIDKKSTDATEEQILLAVNIDGIAGVNIRDDLCVIEFVCKSDAVVETAVNTVFKVDGKKEFVAILPRHKTNKSILIKIANVPFGGEAEMKLLLKNHWTQYGKVLDLAPYKFPGKPWLTKRWDVLLQLADGQKKLTASPVFTLEGFMDSLVCSWPGSHKACIRCKLAGHSTSSCPVKNPKIRKVEALANPHQKINDARQDKNRTAEATPTSSSGSAPATALATEATPATVAQPSLAAPATPAPATLPEVEFTVAIPATLVPPSTAATSEAGAAFSFGQVDTRGKGPEVQRIHTPPPIGQPDPDTPRKDRKRGAKAEAWIPSLREISAYMEVHRLCEFCLKEGHRGQKCPHSKTRIPLGNILTHPRFQQRYKWWVNERQNTKRPNRYMRCRNCNEIGHMEEECTEPVRGASSDPNVSYARWSTDPVEDEEMF